MLMISSLCYRSKRKWIRAPSWSLLWYMTTTTHAWVHRGVPSVLFARERGIHRASLDRWFRSSSSNDDEATKAVASTSSKENHNHYIFGYGSLMCPESRRITNANFKDVSLEQPVLIQDWERRWCARTMTGYTAVGVVPSSTVDSSTQRSSSCMGLLLGAVTDAELADVDRREASYHRYSVPLQLVESLSFTDATDANNRILSLPILGKQGDNANPNVWVYVPKRPVPPDGSHPIVQSYVDIILRGCLETGGETMARSFIATTAGWLHSSTNPSDGNPHWVDDRATPIYKRADVEYSQKNAAKIDALLFDELEQMTGVVQREVRQLYDPTFHLQQLEQALERNAAHPLALQHVRSCLQNAKSS